MLTAPQVLLHRVGGLLKVLHGCMALWHLLKRQQEELDVRVDNPLSFDLMLSSSPAPAL